MKRYTLLSIFTIHVHEHDVSYTLYHKVRISYLYIQDGIQDVSSHHNQMLNLDDKIYICEVKILIYLIRWEIL